MSFLYRNFLDSNVGGPGYISTAPGVFPVPHRMHRTPFGIRMNLTLEKPAGSRVTLAGWLPAIVSAVVPEPALSQDGPGVWLGVWW